jgi:hypothetical protein
MIPPIAHHASARQPRWESPFQNVSDPSLSGHPQVREENERLHEMEMLSHQCIDGSYSFVRKCFSCVLHCAWPGQRPMRAFGRVLLSTRIGCVEWNRAVSG